MKQVKYYFSVLLLMNTYFLQANSDSLVRIIDVVKELQQHSVKVKFGKFKMGNEPSSKPASPKLSKEEQAYEERAKAFKMPASERDKKFAEHVQNCIIEVIQISALQQSAQYAWPQDEINPGLNWSRVAQGEGGNCGYHALKNVVLLMDILKQPRFLTDQDREMLKMIADVNTYLNFMKENASLIDQKFRKGADLSWIGGGELEYLKKFLPEQQRHKILIVEHVAQQGFEFTQHILQAVKKFKQSPKDMLGLVWNSGFRTDLRNMGGSHWVGFVAVKNMDRGRCVIQLYVMDSGAGQGGAYVQRVQDLLSLSTNDIDKILQLKTVEHMMQDIETLSNPLRREPPILQDIVDVILINWKDYTLPIDVQRQIFQWLKRTWAVANEIEKQYLRDRFVRLRQKLNLLQQNLDDVLARG